MQYETTYDYRIESFKARVYSGRNALASLPAEIKRQKARRAFIICGRSVSRKTPLINDLRKLLGDVLVGVYDEMGKDTPLADCEAARDAARSAAAPDTGDRRSVKSRQRSVARAGWAARVRAM